MSSMMRKLARGISRKLMKETGMKLHKQYAPVDMKVKQYGKMVDGTVMKSVFARQWREYL